MSLLPLPRPPVAFLLDFDGVIVDSVALKTEAFARVYAGEDPARLADIMAYQARHGGVTRRDKFVHFERHIFGRPGDATTIDRLAAAYREVVYEAVLGCAFIPGAEAFLAAAAGRADLHLISGTPHGELVDILERRALACHFRSVHGAPSKKREAFAMILEAGCDPARALAIGDALTEFHAARALGIPFLGVVAPGEANPFPDGTPVVPTLEGLAPLLGLH